MKKIFFIFSVLFMISIVYATEYSGTSKLCLTNNINTTCFNGNGTFYLTDNSYTIELYHKENDLKSNDFILEVITLVISIGVFIVFVLILVRLLMILKG